MSKRVPPHLPLKPLLSRLLQPKATLVTLLAVMALVPAAAAAGEIDARAAYVINLAGFNIASADIRFTDTGKRFAVDIGADISGVGTLVARGTASAEAAGDVVGGRLVADDFYLRTHANDQDFALGVQFASGSATGFQVTPPLLNLPGRVAIERKHLKDVADPVAAFIVKADALSPELCERRLNIFTGMERYDLQLSFAEMQTATSRRTGYQGPVVLCRMQYIPISGHLQSSEVTSYLAASNKLLVWYAPLAETGYFIPYRVLIGTAAGDLSMVLTRMEL